MTVKLLVKYRYSITMPDKVKPYSEILEDWTKTKIKFFYEGKTGMLVSPIFRELDNSKNLFCQLLLDIEGKTGTEEAFNYSKRLKRRFPFLTIEFTGKTGFHLASSFLVQLENDETRIIRNQMLGQLSLISIVDQISSIRDMPTIRIGNFFYPTNRFAFPILDDWDYDNFIKHKYDEDFSKIFSIEDLKSYIHEFILPNRIISYQDYLEMIK